MPIDAFDASNHTPCAAAHAANLTANPTADAANPTADAANPTAGAANPTADAASPTADAANPTTGAANLTTGAANLTAPDKQAPIGVFDSGLGGLTAVRELRRLLPHEDIIYFGDTGRVPYGTRGVDTILQYAKQDIAFLLSKRVKYVMAACGTVSSTLPRAYTDALPIPYTGVVDSAAQAAVAATKTGRIGVIGTPATVKSGSYNEAILRLLPTAHITATGCPLFVPLVENGYFGADNQVTRLVAQDYLRDVKRAGVDTLILGCTHYPLIAPILADLMGPSVTLIDPGRETARTAQTQLTRAGLLHAASTAPNKAAPDLPAALAASPTGTAQYFVSDSTDSFSQLAGWFLGSYAGGKVSRISVDGYVV